MKKLTALLTLVLLPACISVDDPGPYWEKGNVDPEILGHWKTVSVEEGQKEVEEINITAHGKDLRVDEAKGKPNDKGKEDKQQGPFRSLRVGPYRFLMEKETGLNMFRYEIKGNALIIYDEKPEAIKEYLKKSYPNTQDIFVKGFGDTTDEVTYVQIKRFTEEVFDILSKIPNNATYWGKNSHYEKIN